METIYVTIIRAEGLIHGWSFKVVPSYVEMRIENTSFCVNTLVDMQNEWNQCFKICLPTLNGRLLFTIKNQNHQVLGNASITTPFTFRSPIRLYISPYNQISKVLLVKLEPVPLTEPSPSTTDILEHFGRSFQDVVFQLKKLEKENDDLRKEITHLKGLIHPDQSVQEKYQVPDPKFEGTQHFGAKESEKKQKEVVICTKKYLVVQGGKDVEKASCLFKDAMQKKELLGEWSILSENELQHDAETYDYVFWITKAPMGCRWDHWYEKPSLDLISHLSGGKPTGCFLFLLVDFGIMINPQTIKDFAYPSAKWFFKEEKIIGLGWNEGTDVFFPSTIRILEEIEF